MIFLTVFHPGLYFLIGKHYFVILRHITTNIYCYKKKKKKHNKNAVI